ncbi:MAG: TPM domain-containing protein [Burkholderiaceae bacterium]
MIQRLTRALKHLISGSWTVNGYFSDQSLQRIEERVTAGEVDHSAEIRVVIEGSLSFGEVLWQDRQPRERALEVFADLHVWDTQANNGILIYLLLADHDVEILADRAADKEIAPAVWEGAIELIREAFARQAYEEGVINAVQSLNEALARRFPPSERNPDELPNKPVIL